MLPSTSMARSAKRRRRKRLDAPESLEDLLDRAGEDRFAKRRPPIPMREWKVVVGPRIADRHGFYPGSFRHRENFFDMCGNVWQWCNDFCKVDYYAQSPAQDPRGPSEGDTKVVRSGASYLSSFASEICLP